MSAQDKPTGKKGKKAELDREKDARLGVWIDGDIDQALRDRIAKDDATKRQIVEDALRKWLGLTDAQALA